MKQERLLDLFDYRGGRLFHKRRIESSAYDARFNRLFSGRAIGTKHHTGYLVHTVDERQYGVHRLVFCYHKGYMPDCIDHENQDKTDNRIENLIDSSPKHNGMNRKRNANNKSGVVGVYFDNRRKKYKAQIKVSGRQMTIGYFSTLEQAAEARKAAELKHGFSVRHGS